MTDVDKVRWCKAGARLCSALRGPGHQRDLLQRAKVQGLGQEDSAHFFTHSRFSSRRQCIFLTFGRPGPAGQGQFLTYSRFQQASSTFLFLEILVALLFSEFRSALSCWLRVPEPHNMLQLGCRNAFWRAKHDKAGENQFWGLFPFGVILGSQQHCGDAWGGHSWTRVDAIKFLSGGSKVF